MKAGDKFGRWTVLTYGSDNRTGRSLCECECGTRREVLNINLLNGKSSSCGCKKKERGREVGMETQRKIDPHRSTKPNTTGYKGVIDTPSCYQVRLAVGGFRTAEEAHKCYVFLKEKAREYQDGTFGKRQD